MFAFGVLHNGSHALFTGPAITEFSEFCFKNGSHGTIHVFKNYFATVFSAISFQFSGISNIQTDPKRYKILKPCGQEFEKRVGSRWVTCERDTS